jgi:cytochrome c oxidase subunit 1
MMYLAVIGSLIHGFSIPASVELGLRGQGHTKGLFGWLRRAPWGEPGFAALAVSLFLFGVVGGISGVIIGGPQVNLIMHNTLLSPAHFHMTVVAGTTVAFMGLAYYLVPLMFQRQLVFRRLAQWQPYLYGGGMTIWALGMGLAGHWGVPRRHWDILFSDLSTLKPEVFDSPVIAFFLALLGIGAILAVIGGAMFVTVIVATVVAGHRTSTPVLGRIMPDTFAPVPVIAGGSGEVPAGHAELGGHGKVFETPGALALALIFLAIFVVLYGISWYELSTLPWLVN